MKTPVLSASTPVAIVEALVQGRLSDAVDIVMDETNISPIYPLLKNILDLIEENNLSATVGSIGKLLSDDAELLWSIDLNDSRKEAALSRLVQFSNLKSYDASDNGLTISVGPSERSQIRHDFSCGNQETIFVHLLIRANFINVSEAFAAIRWLHGGDAEEVMLRYRTNGIVIGQSIEIRLNHSTEFNLLSIGRHQGADIILFNGLPFFWRSAKNPMPTGIAIDFIGATNGTSRADILLFLVSTGCLPDFCKNIDFGAWTNNLIKAYSIAADLDNLSLWLHALDGVEFTLSQENYQIALAANLAKKQGYRDYLTDALISKLPKKERATQLQTLAGIEPAAIVKVENATVKISSNPSTHASLRNIFGKKTAKLELLSNISFRAYPGDIVGIIGKNGAGKTTFLKTLVAAMPLSSGKISVDGRPLLLRPGAGMQGDLSGRENLLKTGLYMGFLPDEMWPMMDEIISFAELEDHIDRPFRYYSDGMRARLVFALATAIPRDILLLDELLSAGDMGFQRKAVKRLDEFIARAKLVFVVQHTFDFVLSRCTKCLLLDHGRPVYFGDPRIATEIYKESL